MILVEISIPAKDPRKTGIIRAKTTAAKGQERIRNWVERSDRNGRSETRHQMNRIQAVSQAANHSTEERPESLRPMPTHRRRNTLSKRRMPTERLRATNCEGVSWIGR